MELVKLPIFLILSTTLSLTQAGTITLVNNCGYNVWAGSQGDNVQGFSLNQGDSNSFESGNGNVYGLTGCDGNGQNCDSTANTATLAEFNWDNDGQSWYDLSAVDGYNVPMQITPNDPSCQAPACNFDLNNCPSALQAFNSAGNLVNCISPCRKYNDQSCNLGHDNVDTTGYDNAIHSACPTTYAYPSDDKATFNCPAGSNGFTITFCF